jgi:hypothetical protein
MKNYELTIEPDLRDCSLFNDIIEDNSTVCNLLVREYSNIWTFLADDLDEAEDMLNEIDEMVDESGSGCIIHTSISHKEEYS